MDSLLTLQSKVEINYRCFVRVYGTHSIEGIYRGDSDDRFVKRVGVYLDEIVGTTLNRLMQYHKIT